MRKKALTVAAFLALGAMITSCHQPETTTGKSLRLIVLEPGHFHAALVQKFRHDELDSVVHVYATEGPEVKDYLAKIEKFNARAENPTHWEEKVYTGPDFLEKMLSEKQGNVVVLAGNNQKKTDFIKKSVDAGLNVLSDKPMAIDEAGFGVLQSAFESAEKNRVLLYDIMTERYEITNTLQRELALLPELFGTLQKGTPEDPAVMKESVHHFFKYVAGEPLIRPAWFFDTRQQGEGIVDVTTHLVDLIQWSCFPDQVLDYKKDIQITKAAHSATQIRPSQFKLVTKKDSYPDFLHKDVKDSVLSVYANGTIDYALKGVHARVSVIWNFQAPEGTGDTHYSVMKGTKARLVIRQGKEQKFKPVLYIEAVEKSPAYGQAVAEAFKKVQARYPGIDLKADANGWQVVIDPKYDTGHESHFSQVADKYMGFLKEGKLPAWEVPNMIAKYYTTTQALKLARKE
ncbi:putative oxidoreductase C-terminal domain-containing protein [Siphonobacter aquaeclarae]|uniref:Oxidoreductase family, NAD-binding Rossmann fold n=1 Tax=Siphonobacter aquaeclarae TaxID=563176 RepID=A0A1G9IX94_9BACT|nr:putative oxidoreductase C-terminal domain-containing protein [Siphonobacter aquaeclarae]SDL29899.1 Oxidoreductase family, NAD-binding Rossmann fold [Siphonobacter aquaeclarae]